MSVSLNAHKPEVKVANFVSIILFACRPVDRNGSILAMAKLDRQMNIGLSEELPNKVLIECGVDEVGIGSAIAEVYAAACILDPVRRINGLRDSKQLTPERREQLSGRIKERALDYCLA